MKNKLINFLFKKRIKILRNKKGFSLLEVLVAVAIIGIITAIAVPTYTANRTEAAKTAGMTSIHNMYKAYQNCLVLKSFNECNTLAEIGITCPDCKEDSDADNAATKKFCAYIEKESGGKTFRACVSVEGNTVKRSIGGDLLDEVKICHEEAGGGGAGNNAWTTVKSVMAQIKYCSDKTECGTDSTCVSGTNCVASARKYHCVKSQDDGDCDSMVCS